MSVLTIPYIIILLVSLCLILVLSGLSIKRGKLRDYFLPLLGISLILVTVSFLMDVRKIYQCALEVPDQIRIFGNVKENFNFHLNNYLVLLYKDNVQIAYAVAANDKFDVDNPHDGKFEIVIDNVDRLTRCSMLKDFNQESSGHNFLLSNNKTTRLLQNFTDIRSDAHVTLNNNDKKEKYILKVLPSSQDSLLHAVYDYSTYLDQGGKIRVNAPIKIFTMQGNLPISKPTNYVVLRNLSLASLPPEMNLNGFEARSAWVESETTGETPGAIIMDNSSINVDNCEGQSSIKQPVTVELAFMRKVEFQPEALPNYNLENYDLAMIALKASQSLGFTQGEISIQETVIEVDVPAGAHKIYKPVWQEVWKTGVLEIDSGPGIIKLPFRASNVIDKSPDIFYAACP